MTEITGQCLCGACRYAFSDADILWQQLCYCDSCRRAGGASAVGWIGVRSNGVRLIGTTLGCYKKLPTTERQFCTTCGSHLTYRSEQWPDEIHITAGTLSEADMFVPTGQVHCAERPAGSPFNNDLPAHPGQSPG